MLLFIVALALIIAMPSLLLDPMVPVRACLPTLPGLSIACAVLVAFGQRTWPMRPLCCPLLFYLPDFNVTFDYLVLNPHMIQIQVSHLA